MKYIKYFENKDIDWEDFDLEEEGTQLDIKVGDRVIFLSNTKADWWNSNYNTWTTMMIMGVHVVRDIKTTDEIHKDDQNNYPKGTIPYDGYLVLFKDSWPWFKLENIKKI